MDTIEISGGTRIDDACIEAVAEAKRRGAAVRFSFNDTDVIAEPGSDPATLADKWHANSEAARQAYLASDEYKQREAKRAEQDRQARAATMVEVAQSESEMRDAKVPWPHTKEQLTQYVESLVNRQHDYGTCVYAMSMAACAAFYYVANQLGVTGFQSSCADMDFIKRTRHMDGPFMLVDASKALYPQYDLMGEVTKMLVESRPWLKERAAKKLTDSPDAVETVLAHWRRLAE